MGTGSLTALANPVREADVSSYVKRSKRIILTPYLYLLPALLLFAVFFVYPFFFSFDISLSHWNLVTLVKRFVGWANYRSVVGDPVFWRSALNTALYVCVSVPASVALGLLYALVIEQTGRFRTFYRFVFFLPVVVSVAASGLSFSMIFSPVGGLADAFLSLFGLHGRAWLEEPGTALLAVLAVGVWHSFGYNVVLYIAGLKQIDHDVYRAAEVDGAGDRHKLIHITLPLLSPVHLFSTVITLIFSFQVFSIVQIMTMGGPDNASNVLVLYIWTQAFQFYDIGPAAAAAVLLFVLVALITVFSVRVVQNRIHYR